VSEIVAVVSYVAAVVADFHPVMTDFHAVVVDIATVVKTALGLGAYGEEEAGGEEYGQFRVHLL